MTTPSWYTRPDRRRQHERKAIFRWLSQPSADDGSAWLTPAEAAEMLGVSTRRLANYTRKGGIRSVYTPGGHHRYIRADVQALLHIAGKSPARLPPPDTLRLAAEAIAHMRNDENSEEGTRAQD